jgi:beta-1,2-mannobiose phosphorylase / 1,2-beta-oligomannan phosphorylase
MAAFIKKEVFLWDKNVIFFPRRINGKLCFLHRVRPDIQIVAVNDLNELTNEFWVDYFLRFDENILLSPKYQHEVSYIGGGCPPIETEHGWLLIYHGVHDTIKGYVYSACAALLDLQDPQKEIARLPYALFKPEHDWELKGEVDNVCFPTGTYLSKDTLYIYYGAADEQIACASVSISALVEELLLNKNNYDK